jgi:hypothetical protein
MASRTPMRILVTTLASLLVLPAVAYAQDDEPTLCDALDIAAASELTGLEFEPVPSSDTASGCRYRVEDGSDDQYVHLYLSELEPYAELIAGFNDEVELEIEDRAAFGRVYELGPGSQLSDVFVDFGSTVLLVRTAAPGINGDTQLDYTVAMARDVVASMAELGLPEGPAAVDPEAVASLGFVLPTVDNLAFYDLSEQPQAAESFAGLMGVEPADATAIVLLPRPCPECPFVGILTAVRVSGADESAMREAISTIAAAQGGSAGEEAVLGGKDVILLPPTDGVGSVVYVAGDTAYIVQLEEPWDIAVLEALP